MTATVLLTEEPAQGSSTQYWSTSVGERVGPALALGSTGQMNETTPVAPVGPQIEPSGGGSEHRFLLGPVGRFAPADTELGLHLI